MIDITLTRRDQSLHSLQARPGDTLMEAIRNAGFDDIEAICGGCASCATCHVYVDASFPLPEMEELEDELLESSFTRRENSRLSCQLVLPDGSGQLRVFIPSN